MGKINNFWKAQNGYSKAGHHSIVSVLTVYMKTHLGYVLESLQMLFHPCIVDSQKLVGSSHHVNVIMLSVCAFLIEELENRIFIWRCLQDARHDLEECFSERCRSTLGDTSALGFKGARLIWRRVQASKGNQCFLAVKASYISNLGHELRSKGVSDAMHCHDNIILR